MKITLLVRTLLLIFFSMATAVAQQPDSTDRGVPPGYRIFFVSDSIDFMVVGREENQLYGTPRNDGSAEAMPVDQKFLKNNFRELIWMFDRAITLERAEELCRQNPDGELGAILYFVPEPRFKEIYFMFTGYGGKVPLTRDEMDMIGSLASDKIGAWYQEPDRVFEKAVQKQYYIDWPWELPMPKFLKYKRSGFHMDTMY